MGTGHQQPVTADGLLSVLRLLQDPHYFSPDLRQEMLDILHVQEFKSGIPAGLPDGASGPRHALVLALNPSALGSVHVPADRLRDAGPRAYPSRTR